MAQIDPEVAKLRKKVRAWKPSYPVPPPCDTVGDIEFPREISIGFVPKYLKERENMCWVMGYEYQRLWLKERDEFRKQFIKPPPKKDDIIKKNKKNARISVGKKEVQEPLVIEDNSKKEEDLETSSKKDRREVCDKETKRPTRTIILRCDRNAFKMAQCCKCPKK